MAGSFARRWQRSWAFLFGLLAPAAAALVLYHVVQFWPLLNTDDPTAAVPVQLAFGWTWTLTGEQAFVVLAAGGGLLGGLLYTMGQYAQSRRQSTFRYQDANWYWVRCVIGAGLGLTVYLLIRSGLFVLGGDTSDDLPDAFGVLGVSVVVGLFTDKVLTKLSELAGNFFASKEELDALAGVVAVPRVSPPALQQGVKGQHLSVIVDNGAQPLQVAVDGQAHQLAPNPDSPDTYLAPVDDAHVDREVIILDVVLSDGSTWRRPVPLVGTGAVANGANGATGATGTGATPANAPR